MGLWGDDKDEASQQALAAALGPKPGFWWDDDRRNPEGNCALRGRNDEVVLVVMFQRENWWGVYQPTAPDWRGRPDISLIQIRASRQDARDCALEMARRKGLVE